MTIYETVWLLSLTLGSMAGQPNEPYAVTEVDTREHCIKMKDMLFKAFDPQWSQTYLECTPYDVPVGIQI